MWVGMCYNYVRLYVRILSAQVVGSITQCFLSLLSTDGRVYRDLPTYHRCLIYLHGYILSLGSFFN